MHTRLSDFLLVENDNNNNDYYGETRSTPINGVVDFYELAKEHCSMWLGEDITLDYLKDLDGSSQRWHTKSKLHDKMIVRGTKSRYDYAQMNPSEFSRGSIEQENIHTLIMDTFPSWKGWPKYSGSVICTTSTNYASFYGNLYEVIPFDNAVLAVTPKIDIWNSFGGFNRYAPIKLTDAIIRHNFGDTRGYDPDDDELYREMLNTDTISHPNFLNNWSPMDSSDRVKRIIDAKTGKELALVLDEEFSPIKNKFYKITYTGVEYMTVDPEQAAQVWTSDSVLLRRIK